MKRLVSVILCMTVCFGLLAGCQSGGTGQTSSAGSQSTEETTVHAVIQWAEGGGTDSVMRPLLELANQESERTIAVENKVGLAGAVGYQYVMEQPADGSYLLVGAENPALYPTLGYSESGYENFDCLCLVGSETVGVAVRADSPFQSFRELVEASLQGEEVVVATTNVGGMPWTVSAMVQNLTGASFVQQWYSGDQAAKQAVLDGEADFTFCKLQIGLEDFNSGELRYLNVIADTSVDLLPGVPAVTEEYPAFQDYLPWGPFYGVFVKSGCPEETKQELQETFLAAFESEDYQSLLASAHITPLGLSGEEAADYISQWQTKTVSILAQSDLNQSFRFQVEG